MDFAFQLGGSLLAILALAWLAHRLGLGGDTRVQNEDDVRALANEAIDGFTPTEIALDRAGTGALCRDGEGRVLVLRRHGSHWASRLIGPQNHASFDQAQLDRGLITLATADRRFGDVTLDLGADASVWATRLADAGGSRHERPGA